MMHRLVALLLVLGLAAPAFADYQIRGRFLYRDRGFTQAGLSGVDADLPIRLADVQVVDDAENVLGSTATGLDGSFSLQVIDASIRNVRVRVLSRALGTPSLQARVFVTGTTTPYAVASSVIANHSPTQDIDLTATPVVALQGQGGEAFNIFDQILDAFDFIATLRGARPTTLLTAYWAVGATDGTYFSVADNSVHYLGHSTDSDGYDDTVILHEIGHYTETTFSATDTSGGPHSVNGYYRLVLTWSEGYATFFENMVRSWRGDQDPETYVDTSGQPGVQRAFLSYEVETPSVGRLGANNEVAVNAALWDVVDTPATADFSPGLDDDPLSLADGPLRFWHVFTQYLPAASTISIEDFWDGWFSPTIANGSLTEMRLTFAGHGMEYFPDVFEPDDSTLTARLVTANGGASRHTFYPLRDQDWVRFHVVTDSIYTLQTTDLSSGADTRLQLYSPTLVLLADNDDRSPGDPSSSISYTPVATGTVFLRCMPGPNSRTDANYGSYDVLVTAQVDTLPVYRIQVAATDSEVTLSWQARPDVGLVAFEVDRSTVAGGPWQLRTVLPAVAGETSYAWADTLVSPGDRWFYRIVASDSGARQYTFGPYEVSVPSGAGFPARFVLHPPSPNPFTPETHLRYELPRAELVTLRIYASDGRLVRLLLASASKPAGPGSATWDGRDDHGRVVSSGVYIVQMEAGPEHATHRAVLVR